MYSYLIETRGLYRMIEPKRKNIYKFPDLKKNFRFHPREWNEDKERFPFVSFFRLFRINNYHR